jgi:hypothetical protein
MATIGRAFTVSIGLSTILFCAMIVAETPANTNPSSGSKAVLVIGATNVKPNAHGMLTAGTDGLSFASKGHVTKVASDSMEKITVGSESRQSGGTPLTVAKIAIPYGGGRVVSLFAHEKFDTLTIEYRDANGGYHGAVFNLPKGQADPLQAALGTPQAKVAAGTAAPTGSKIDGDGWAIQLEKIDPGGTAISQEFLVATYEYLVAQLEKSHKYVNVLRSGDANAASYPKLLILKTHVEKYVSGNETARAVTTVKGWTKLGVKMQIDTSDGHSVLNKDVESNVRFYGNNLRATQTLSKSMVKVASTASLP